MSQVMMYMYLALNILAPLFTYFWHYHPYSLIVALYLSPSLVRKRPPIRWYALNRECTSTLTMHVVSTCTVLRPRHLSGSAF